VLLDLGDAFPDYNRFLGSIEALHNQRNMIRSSVVHAVVVLHQFRRLSKQHQTGMKM
jgi:hypothetical protein